MAVLLYQSVIDEYINIQPMKSQNRMKKVKDDPMIHSRDLM